MFLMPRSVRRALDLLVDSGELTRTSGGHGRGDSSHYSLTADFKEGVSAILNQGKGGSTGPKRGAYRSAKGGPTDPPIYSNDSERKERVHSPSIPRRPIGSSTQQASKPANQRTQQGSQRRSDPIATADLRTAVRQPSKPKATRRNNQSGRDQFSEELGTRQCHDRRCSPHLRLGPADHGTTVRKVSRLEFAQRQPISQLASGMADVVSA